MKKSLFLFSFILLSLCFLTALCLPFAHHDIVRYFDKFYTSASANLIKHDPQYAMVYLLGRPLTGEIHQFIYTHVSTIGQLSFLRCLTVAAFSLCSGLLANIFYSLGLNLLESLALSVAVFILPGVQDAVIMLGIQNAFAVGAVLWAYLISARPHRSSLEDWIENTIIFFLILTSMLLYPQFSFFLFVPFLVKYLITPRQDLRKIYQEFFRLSLIFCLCAIFYFFYIKTFVSVHNASAGSYAFTIDLNFFYWKLLSVFTKILPMSFCAWDFHTMTSVGFLLMGLTIFLLQRRTLICFLLIFSTTSLWLLARSDLILHRIFFATSAMALLALLMGIRGILHRDGAAGRNILIGATTAGLLFVNHLTTLNAINYYTELRFYEARLLEHQQIPTRIHIVLPVFDKKGYNGQETVDDMFNAKTSAYNFKTDTLNLLKAALKEDGFSTSMRIYSCEDDQMKCLKEMPADYQLLVTHSTKDQRIEYSPHMILIDLSTLY